jgi:hypothetical protein
MYYFHDTVFVYDIFLIGIMHTCMRDNNKIVMIFEWYVIDHIIIFWVQDYLNNWMYQDMRLIYLDNIMVRVRLIWWMLQAMREW